MNNHNSASFECTGRTENLLVRVVLGGPFCLPSCCIVRIEVDEEDDEDDEEAEDVEEDSEEMEDGGWYVLTKVQLGSSSHEADDAWPFAAFLREGNPAFNSGHIKKAWPRWSSCAFLSQMLPNCGNAEMDDAFNLRVCSKVLAYSWAVHLMHFCFEVDEQVSVPTLNGFKGRKGCEEWL